MSKFNETIDLNKITDPTTKSLDSSTKTYDESFDLKSAGLDFNTARTDKFNPDESFFNPVGSSGIGKSQYDEGISLGQLSAIPLEKIRGQRQGVFDQLANAVVGGVGSGLVGAVEGFSNIADQLINIGNSAEEWERSALSETLKELKTDINDLTPIYRTDRADTFDWDNSGFYFEFLKGVVDSAVAFSLPGMGYGMGVAKLGNLLGKTALAGKRLDVLTRAGGRALGVNNLSNKLTTGTAALLSNYNEGTVMGLQTYDEEKERIINILTQDALQDRPEGEGLSEEELKEIELTASQEAGKAAEYVRDFNHLMIASNYISLKGLVGNPVKQGITRNMVEKPGTKLWLKNQALSAPAESLEEIGQGVLQREISFQTQDSIYKDLGIDPTSIQGVGSEDYLAQKGMTMGTRLLDFATQDETLLEGMMGLFGGPVQYAVTGLPAQKSRNAALNTQYAKQQGLIGQNKEFIKSKLLAQQNTQEILGAFDDFRKQLLNKTETTEEDSQKFNELIEDTAFDQLVVENFFGGTTADLEKQLQAVGQDQNAKPEEKAAAEKHLKRLGELEGRFEKYNQYQDGSDMFATQLRIERLNNIAQTLEQPYRENEAEATKLINDKLEQLTKAAKVSKPFTLEDFLFFEEEQKTTDDDGKETTTKVEVPVRSVQQAIDGITQGKKLLGKGSIFSLEEFQQGKAFQTAQHNRFVLDKIKNSINFYQKSLDEAKSTKYENLYAQYQDALSNPDFEEKVNALKEFDKELNKNTKEKEFQRLKARVNTNVKQYEKALAQGKKSDKDAATQTTNAQTAQAQSEKVAAKNGKAPVVQPAANVSEDIFPNVDVADGPSTSTPIQKAEEAARAKKAAEEAAKQGTSSTQTTQSTQTQTKPENVVSVKYSKQGKEVEEDFIVTPEGTFFYDPKKPNGKGNAVGSSTLANKVKMKADPKTVMIKKTRGKGDKAKELTYAVTSDGEVFLVKDSSKPNETFSQKQSPSDKADIIKEAEEKRSGKKSETTSTETTNGIEAKKTVIENTSSTLPVTPPQALADESKDTTADTFEIIPTTGDDSKTTKANLSKAQDKAKLSVEGNGKDDGTRAKLMTTGSTSEFETKVLKNGRDKTGMEVPLTITLDRLPQGLDGNSARLANEARVLFQQVLSSGEYTSSQIEFLVKYLPIAADFGQGALSWIYPMNWKNDSTQNPSGVKNFYTDKQNKGEAALRKKVIIASLKGTNVTVKVKGQLPGALDFGDQDVSLSEISWLMDNPMGTQFFISIDGFLQNAVKGNPYNPFLDTFMSYESATGPQPWTGIIVMEIKALNGMSFPLKLNTKNHSDESASILYDLYNAMVNAPQNKNLMGVSVKENFPSLYERIKTLLPNLTNFYGEGFTYAEAIGDMVFQGTKTQGRVSELYFDKGKVIFGGNSLTAQDFLKPENKAKFIEFIKNNKAFNVDVSKMNSPEYRKHVFQSYLSTNANVNDMFTSDGTLNPSGDSYQRMKSGAMYLDVTSAKEEEVKEPKKTKEEIKTAMDKIKKIKKSNIASEKKKRQEEAKKQLFMFSDPSDIAADLVDLGKQEDPFGFNNLSSTSSDKPKDWNKEQPKSKVEKMVEEKKKAEEKAKEIDRCEINKAAAKKAAKGKFGDIDLTL